MGNVKTCDMHEKAFPNNMVDLDHTEMVTVYVERKLKDPKDPKKKITATMFVGSAESEGAEVCLKDFVDVIANRITPVGGRISWKQVIWTKVKKQKKDGTEYEANEKSILDVE